MKMTIGHDSEFGLSHGGNIQSALEVLRSEENEHGRIFPDNMNAEIAINPVTTLKDFHAATESLLGLARDQGFDLIMDPIIKYPDRCLDHPEARISGCNPDLSAYRMDNNIPPDFETMDGTRSCGAHIHTGDNTTDPYNQAMWMDLMVTLPLLKHEKATERRSMYGGAGCIRVKPYGMEYRTLSNVWLDDPALREFVWEATHKAVEVSKREDFQSIVDWPDVPTAIDTHDLELAQRTLDRLYIYGVTV